MLHRAGLPLLHGAPMVMTQALRAVPLYVKPAYGIDALRLWGCGPLAKAAGGCCPGRGLLSGCISRTLAPLEGMRSPAAPRVYLAMPMDDLAALLLAVAMADAVLGGQSLLPEMVLLAASATTLMALAPSMQMTVDSMHVEFVGVAARLGRRLGGVRVQLCVRELRGTWAVKCPTMQAIVLPTVQFEGNSVCLGRQLRIAEDARRSSSRRGSLLFRAPFRIMRSALRPKGRGVGPCLRPRLQLRAWRRCAGVLPTGAAWP